MMIEERTRFEVLLENIQTSANVIAEGHGVLVERLDRLEGRLDRLEGRFDRSNRSRKSRITSGRRPFELAAIMERRTTRHQCTTRAGR